MDYVTRMKTAFDDELEKISGALQGHVRSGRRPLKVETLLDKEKQDTKAVRKKVADLTKVSAEGGLKSGLNKAQVLGMLGIGAYGMHRAQKIRRRYEMGRQLEMQQQQGW